MQYHVIPCNTMQYNVIPCIINNCWRSVSLPSGQYNGHFFFAIACAMSWDGEHVWGRPTHRIHRACRIGPLLSIQRHLISYNQLTYKRFKEHSNSKLNQVVQCWWNYTCKLHCCVDGSNSIWLPWTLHITRGTVLAFIFSQAQGRQEQKQPQNGIKWEWAKWNIQKIKV